MNAITKVIIKTTNKAEMKILSAILSNRLLTCTLEFRIDKNENTQLAINNIHAIPVNSSIFDTSLNFEILSEVNTIKQNPNKFDEVFKMCCDLLLVI